MSDIEKEVITENLTEELTGELTRELVEMESHELPDSDELHADEGVEAIEELVEAPIEDHGELAQFEAAEIEEIEFVEDDQLLSIIESILFASDRPTSVESIKSVFKGTNVKTKDIRRAIEELSVRYADAKSGVMLEEIGGGYQLRTKIDNVEYMKKHVKGRSFKLSGPALEVLSIVAYKQPTIKSEVDEIRGVESGHLMRALMDRGLIRFAGKSELPGKPMYYETTRKFLEIFGLRNINELPSLSEIDQLIPDGIGEVEEEKKTLDSLTGELSVESSSNTYSEGENELLKITEQLQSIDTSSEFFEKEKVRQKRKRDEERAQDIREAIVVGSPVEDKDIKWLKKFEAMLMEEEKAEELRLAAEKAKAESFVEEPVIAGELSEAQFTGDDDELTDDEILEQAGVEIDTDIDPDEELTETVELSLDDDQSLEEAEDLIETTEELETLLADAEDDESDMETEEEPA